MNDAYNVARVQNSWWIHALHEMENCTVESITRGKFWFHLVFVEKEEYQSYHFIHFIDAVAHLRLFCATCLSVGIAMMISYVLKFFFWKQIKRHISCTSVSFAVGCILSNIYRQQINYNILLFISGFQKLSKVFCFTCLSENNWQKCIAKCIPLKKWQFFSIWPSNNHVQWLVDNCLNCKVVVKTINHSLTSNVHFVRNNYLITYRKMISNCYSLPSKLRTYIILEKWIFLPWFLHLKMR